MTFLFRFLNWVNAKSISFIKSVIKYNFKTKTPSKSYGIKSKNKINKPTGDGSYLIEILESLKEQPLEIHDIILHFDSKIHQTLVEKGSRPLHSNKSILVKIPTSDDNICIKALVYPNKVQMHIACSYKPIIFNIKSLESFIDILEEANNYLYRISDTIIPSVMSWIITHFHLGRDGDIEINGRDFHVTVEDCSGGLIRYYSKQMRDGRKIPRFEQIYSPKISVMELMRQMS